MFKYPKKSFDFFGYFIITAPLDSSGVKVVEYSYDAWGNRQVSGSNTKLGNLNPFRYRSYFYDTETELYYLNTRYYDPVYCRFINMDSFDYADPEQLNGLNLYAYCANNPVMGYDPDGTFVISIGIVTALGIAAAGSALLAWIEHTFHPIQNALNYLGDAIGDLFNDLLSNSSGGNIGSGSSIFQPGNIGSKFIIIASLSNIGNIYLSRERNRGRDTGLMGLSDKQLEDELNDAKRKHDSERIQKILKEMKIRGLRNKRKQRGGPHMRGFLLILLGIGAGLYNENRN